MGSTLCILLKETEWVDKHELFDDVWRRSEVFTEKLEGLVKTSVREVLQDNNQWIENTVLFRWSMKRNGKWI